MRKTNKLEHLHIRKHEEVVCSTRRDEYGDMGYRNTSTDTMLHEQPYSDRANICQVIKTEFFSIEANRSIRPPSAAQQARTQRHEGEKGFVRKEGTLPATGGGGEVIPSGGGVLVRSASNPRSNPLPERANRER